MGLLKKAKKAAKKAKKITAKVNKIAESPLATMALSVVPGGTLVQQSVLSATQLIDDQADFVTETAGQVSDLKNSLKSYDLNEVITNPSVVSNTGNQIQDIFKPVTGGFSIFDLFKKLFGG